MVRSRWTWMFILLALPALLLAGCGERKFDAKGLVFEYPDGFVEAEETTNTTLILHSEGSSEQGVVALHWTEVDQPDAKAVISAALNITDAQVDHYNRIRLEHIETAQVADQQADYLELIVEHDEDAEAPRYFGRLLLFSAPDDEAQYILAHVIDLDESDSPGAIKAWERISSTLRFDQNTSQ